MCLFSLFVAVGGEFWKRWCICMSQGELWAQKFPSNYAGDFIEVAPTWFFSFFPPKIVQGLVVEGEKWAK